MLEPSRRGIKAICAALWGMVRVLVAALLVLTIVPGAAEARDRVLVFSATKEFRHASIPAGVTALRELGARHGFAVTVYSDDLECGHVFPAPKGWVTSLSARHALLKND